MFVRLTRWYESGMPSDFEKMLSSAINDRDGAASDAEQAATTGVVAATAAYTKLTGLGRQAYQALVDSGVEVFVLRQGNYGKKYDTLAVWLMAISRGEQQNKHILIQEDGRLVDCPDGVQSYTQTSLFKRATRVDRLINGHRVYGPYEFVTVSVFNSYPGKIVAEMPQTGGAGQCPPYVRVALDTGIESAEIDTAVRVSFEELFVAAIARQRRR